MTTHKMADQRTARTRHALRQALAELVVEYGYEGLTIQQIVARAGVARTTFYRHFQSKDDLLFNGFGDVYEALRTAVAPVEMNNTADWEHVAQYADFYRAMLGPQGSPAFVDFLRQMLAEVMQEQVLHPLASTTTPRLPAELIAHYLAGAQIGLYAWWLANDLQPPAAEMAQAGQDLAVKGVLWAVGLASGLGSPVK